MPPDQNPWSPLVSPKLKVIEPPLEPVTNQMLPAETTLLQINVALTELERIQVAQLWQRPRNATGVGHFEAKF